MKNHNILFFIIGLILVVNFIPSVEAGDLSTDVNTLINGVVDIFEPITQRILGETPGAEWLFAKFLFAILIFSIVWTVLSQIGFFSEQGWATWVMSIAVTVLSVRWIISDKIIQTILLPYTTLGIIISAGIPFIIFGYIVTVGFKRAPLITRKFAWILFAVVFIGMWFSRIDEMGGLAHVYLIFAVAALIMLKMDGTIQRWQRIAEVEKDLDVINFESYTQLLKKRDELQDSILAAKEIGADPKKIENLSGHLGNVNQELIKLYGSVDLHTDDKVYKIWKKK